MYVSSFYGSEPSRGRSKFGASLTQPDMAYSIKQLVADYSVGQMPSLAQLQQYLADEEDVDDVENTFADVRFADKADMFEQTSQSRKIKKAFLEKVKEMHRFKESSKHEDVPPPPTIEEKAEEIIDSV